MDDQAIIDACKKIIDGAQAILEQVLSEQQKRKEVAEAMGQPADPDKGTQRRVK